MADTDQLASFKALIDSYVVTSELMVRLAELAAPACRIEPQLLRQLRLFCVPEADVSVEQELWHSELVNERDETITLRDGALQVLRERLRATHEAVPDVVSTAQGIMTRLHAALPPLLALEEQLAWAEVIGDTGTIGTGARTLFDSLLSRRDGLDNWLGRAWSGLPADLKRRPEGRALGQVAAAKGAQVDALPTPADADTVAHLLPLTPIPLRLHGLALSVNVRPSEATHVIDAPQTLPRALSITSDAGSEELVFGASETKTVHVAPGTVVIRTVTGAEYELEAAAGPGVAMDIELLPAGHSTSVLIEYVDGSVQRRILVDCGDRRTGRLLVERLQRSPDMGTAIDLLVLTHIDDGRIGGAIPLLESEVISGHLRDVWFNGYDEIAGERNAS